MSDLYVFPLKDTGHNFPKSYNEIGAIDLPLSVLEAMSCNLPVITTPFGALPRIFQPCDGLIFCRNDTEILDSVRELPNDLISNTREKVLPYDWKSVIARLDSIYQEIVQ